MSDKSAACKFISSKTMVIPKPGKFPDVENAPIKSDSSGTDNIEDQKYQKDATMDDDIRKEYLNKTPQDWAADREEYEREREERLADRQPWEVAYDAKQDRLAQEEHEKTSAAALMHEAIKQAGLFTPSNLPTRKIDGKVVSESEWGKHLDKQLAATRSAKINPKPATPAAPPARTWKGKLNKPNAAWNLRRQLLNQ